jgi:hypothetical protein
MSWSRQVMYCYKAWNFGINLSICLAVCSGPAYLVKSLFRWAVMKCH